MVETIISDLGNVILPFDHRISCRKLANISGYHEHEIYDFIFKSSLEREYEKGETTSTDFCRKILDRFSLNITFDDFKMIWADIFLEPHPLISKLFPVLKQKYKVYILSNTNEIHFQYIKDKFDIINIADGDILSYQVGFRKPDPSIFHAGLEMAGSAAEGCIYIDDIENYVDAARKIGMIGIHFKSPKQLISELKRYGIL